MAANGNFSVSQLDAKVANRWGPPHAPRTGLRRPPNEWRACRILSMAGGWLRGERLARPTSQEPRSGTKRLPATASVVARPYFWRATRWPGSASVRHGRAPTGSSLPRSPHSSGPGSSRPSSTSPTSAKAFPPIAGVATQRFGLHDTAVGWTALIACSPLMQQSARASITADQANEAPAAHAPSPSPAPAPSHPPAASPVTLNQHARHDDDAACSVQWFRG